MLIFALSLSRIKMMKMVEFFLKGKDRMVRMILLGMKIRMMKKSKSKNNSNKSNNNSKNSNNKKSLYGK